MNAVGVIMSTLLKKMPNPRKTLIRFIEKSKIRAYQYL